MLTYFKCTFERKCEFVFVIFMFILLRHIFMIQVLQTLTLNNYIFNALDINYNSIYKETQYLIKL